MVTPEKEVDAKSAELIKEFTEHFKEYMKFHPEHKDRRADIFQGWVIQKIAGLQLSIIEIAKSVNEFIERYEQERRQLGQR